MQTRWNSSLINYKLTSWQKSAGSLTARLKACGDFRVKVLASHCCTATADEIELLGLKRSTGVYVRTVCLLVDDVPRVIARSVASNRGLKGAWHTIRRQGSRSLGEMLWSNPQVNRGPLQFARLQSRHHLHRELRQSWPELPHTLPARRAIFMKKNQSLIVMEVFLPSLQELQCPLPR